MPCFYKKMILHNVYTFGDSNTKQIHIKNGLVDAVTTADGNTAETVQLHFENALAFPGLINSHDHLDFNLFPQTGNGIYNNYREWGADIHQHNKATIDAVMKVPYRLRLRWGLYKNLLCGVTTVVEHGKPIAENNDLLSVFQHCHNLHSVGFEKNWIYRLNNPFAKKNPFVMHIGEGTDSIAVNEINELLRFNFCKRTLIGIHAVAMNEKQAAKFKALVWCPASNYFLFNKTADVAALKNVTNIIFGTDATLTAGWNIWDHLRLAKKENELTNEALFNAVTKTPAVVWNMSGKGSLEKGSVADIVIARGNGTPDSFFAINPQDILLVLHKGHIRLFDESVKDQLINNNISVANYDKINMGTATKYISGNISGLVHEIKKYYPEATFPFSV
jgi:cytosine/adenosine deaminase-related metal-dependent hydrolase